MLPRRSLLSEVAFGGLLLTIAAGCSAGIRERYTWAPAATHADHNVCRNEANSHYVPLIAFLFGGWQIQQTVYKDCMESRGYTLVGKKAL